MGRRPAAAASLPSPSPPPRLTDSSSRRHSRPQRASLVQLPRRGVRHRANDDHDDDDSSTASSTIHFPRRNPRIGGAFQIKGIPELLSSLSCRPVPLKISVEAPHCTEQQVSEARGVHVAEEDASLEIIIEDDIPLVTADNNKISEDKSDPVIVAAEVANACSSISSKASTTSTEEEEEDDEDAELPMPQQHDPERGGRLVHSANNTDCGYMICSVQHSFYSTEIERQQLANTDQEAWVTKVLHWWHRQCNPVVAVVATTEEASTGNNASIEEVTGTRRTKSKYRRIRNPSPVQTEEQQQQQQPNEDGHEEEIPRMLLCPLSLSASVSTEQEEYTLAYVQERHGGHVQQAILGWQADWTGGRGVSALRRKRKREADHTTTIQDGDAEKGEGDCSESNDSSGTTMPVLLGDYRKRKSRPTQTTQPPPPAIVSKGKRSKPCNNTIELYKAVLAIGTSLQRKCQEKPVILSQILTFVRHAEQLPPLLVETCSTKEDEEFPVHVLDELNACLSSLRESLQLAQKHKAVLLDMWHQQGIDPEVLAKQLEAAAKECDLEGMQTEMERQLQVVLEWQARVDGALRNTSNNIGDGQSSEQRDDLSDLEALSNEATTHGLVSKGYLLLQGKLRKAWHLRDRIQDWKQSKRQESIKFVTAIVRELGRLKILFPEACDLLAFHRQAEAWIDRANIAIRSRISLAEIYALCESQQEMQLDLSEYLEKLETRATSGQEWLDRFKEVVTEVEPESSLECMCAIRKVLQEGGNAMMHDLASEGNRIPVEVDCVKLLQVELDAKSWSAKASKWLPSEDDESSGKKAKLEELEEHMEKANVLRDRLSPLPPKERAKWVLEGECELHSILQAAEAWFDKYDDVLDGDNRRNTRARLSIVKLRRIVEEADAIFVNLASAGSKVARILAQAEKWYGSYSSLLIRCKLLEPADGATPADSDVSLSELTAAVDAARSDIAVDLVEAVQLEELADRIRSWFDSAALADGPKRQGSRLRKGTFSVERLKKLIEQAATFPVDTTEECKRLRDQLEIVEAWQDRAANELEGMLIGFRQLRESINETYGDPSQFARGQPTATGAIGSMNTEDSEMMDNGDEKKAADDVHHYETCSSGSSEQDFGSLTNISSIGDCNLQVLIRNFQKEANLSCIETPEREISSELDCVWRWCIRSLKYLESQREIFDKRFFGAFDRFIAEGRELAIRKSAESLGPEVNSRLRDTWAAVVVDQLERLDVMLAERKRYISWCDTAEQLVFSDDKKVSIEKVRELSKSSHEFPLACDMIKKLRDLEEKANAWIRMASEHLASGEKMSVHEARSLIDDGDKLGVLSNELKILRNGLKSARGWANRVKRCKPELGTTCVADVNALLVECDSLIVEMPEEVAKLQKAVKNYCLCRRPYDGFMIGCDTCDEWFHGPCIGVSESKAGRVDKYVCLRCSVSKVYKMSASTIMGVIRKWMSDKDRRKARQAEAQRHQRKVRKENKEIEGLKEEQEHLRSQLVELENGAEADGCTESVHPVSDSCSSNEVGAMGNIELSNESSGGASSSAITDPEIQSKESLESRLQAIEKSLAQCEDRLTLLAVLAGQRRNEEELEDANSQYMKSFCMRLRSRILIPSSDEQAVRSRPQVDGSMSKVMVDLIDEAGQVGLLRFKDVNDVINELKCLCWSLRASSVVSRHPSDDDVESLVEQASELQLPDEKALRMMKSMAQRAKSWKSKVLKTLAPAPGEVMPFAMDTLKDLADIGDDIPVCMPLESRLLTVIEDKGGRHCLCGGPSDGRFMLSCDSCERWFHGQCVGVSSEVSEELEEWKCPPCAGTNVCTLSLCLDKFHDNFDVELESKSEDSSLCTDVKEMWPPYGLFGSSKAIEALGEECSAIADDFDVYDVLSTVTASMCAPPGMPAQVEIKNGTEQNISFTSGTVGASIEGTSVIPFSGSSNAKNETDQFSYPFASAPSLHDASTVVMVAATIESSQEVHQPIVFPNEAICSAGEIAAAVLREAQCSELAGVEPQYLNIISSGSTRVISKNEYG